MKKNVLFILILLSQTALNAQLPHIVYSTLLGGKSDDYGHSIAVDEKGYAFVAGQTSSSDFPTTTGSFDPTNNGNGDIFISKLNEAGSKLIYSTFIGGSGLDDTRAITIDSTGSVYLTGTTQSSNFPSATSNALTGNQQGYFLKLNAAGSKLDYLSRWAGGSKIIFDSEGYAIICGSTSLTNFPVTNKAYDKTANGGSDIFVAKLDLEHDSIVFSTYLGGSGNEVCYGNCVKIDSMNNIIVTGYTYSNDFPVKGNTFASYVAGTSNVFVTKLKSDGSDVLFSTILGGTGNEYLFSMAVDTIDNIYLSGMTYSNNYPITKNAFDTISNSTVSGFLTKLSSDGTKLIYSTYIGGSAKSSGRGIVVDNLGKVYMTGTTLSTDFPVTDNALFKTYSGCVGCDQYGWGDSFFLIMNPDGNKLEYATYLGGANDEEAYEISRDKTGAIYITGSTNSSGFPTTKGAFQQTKNSALDVYVTKFAFDAPSFNLAVSSNVLNVASQANSTAILGVSSNTSWKIVTSDTWFTASKTNGLNNDSITFKSTANTSIVTRTATITVSGSGVLSQTITLTQEAATTGMSEIVNSGIKLFPNPSTGLFTLCLSSNPVQQAAVEVYNTEGRKIISKSIQKVSTETLDLSIYPKGLYMVSICSDQVNFTEKIIRN